MWTTIRQCLFLLNVFCFLYSGQSSSFQSYSAILLHRWVLTQTYPVLTLRQCFYHVLACLLLLLAKLVSYINNPLVMLQRSTMHMTPLASSFSFQL